MKYYSEILKKLFDTEDALVNAEQKEKVKLAAKAKEEESRLNLIKEKEEALTTLKKKIAGITIEYQNAVKEKHKLEDELEDLKGKFSSDSFYKGYRNLIDYLSDLYKM